MKCGKIFCLGFSPSFFIPPVVCLKCSWKQHVSRNKAQPSFLSLSLPCSLFHSLCGSPVKNEMKRDALSIPPGPLCRTAPGGRVCISGKVLRRLRWRRVSYGWVNRAFAISAPGRPRWSGPSPAMLLSPLSFKIGPSFP